MSDSSFSYFGDWSSLEVDDWGDTVRFLVGNDDFSQVHVPKDDLPRLISFLDGMVKL